MNVESYQAWASRPFTMERAAQLPSYSDALTRADVPKNPMEAYEKNKGFLSTMLLTKDDIALIKKITGIDVDYDTGKITGNDEATPSENQFVTSIMDRRYDDWSRLEPAENITSADMQTIFADSIKQGKDIDPSLMQKSMDWYWESDDSSEKSTGPKLDIYA